MLQQQLGMVAKNTNKLLQGDQAIHSWYRFVLSYPPHLVRDYLSQFSVDSSHVVLDPFCGTGTTLVECKKLGIRSIGIEAHPMTCFASEVKTDWSPEPGALLAHAQKIAKTASAELERSGIENVGLFQDNSVTAEVSLRTLPPDQAELILKNSISPLPLHKVLVLLDFIEQFKDASFYGHERLALAQALVTSIGNLRFGPEVGIGTIKKDTGVVNEWLKAVQVMTSHLQRMQGKDFAECIVYNADSRQVSNIIAPNSIDVVFTSPPYPNEKDYTRTTRLESVLLGFLQSKADLRKVKQSLLRSNTRNVFIHDTDDQWAKEFPEIISLAEQIEKRRIELQKTSGFEKLYSRVTKLFFGGMARHLSDLRPLLRPGAMLGYVVGDQASYFQVMIRTGQHLARIAESLGYEVVSIDPFRTRMATATQSSLSEEVVVLRWPGSEVSLHYHKKEVEMSGNSQYDSNLFGEKLAESGEEYMEDVEEIEDVEDVEDVSSTSRKKRDTRYGQIVEYIFFQHYKEGDEKVDFEREEIHPAADALRVKRIKNLGDLNYSFRYRNVLPPSVRAKAPHGKAWVIRSTGRSQYSFVALDEELVDIQPKKSLTETKIADATPGIVLKYTKRDEQALLAKLRYNRLVDIFTGVTCYSLQNHLRTTVPGIGQVETDEIYIGVDKKGAHYVFPVQAKGGNDKLGIVQIEQDYALCTYRFPRYVRCRPIAAQFIAGDLIALFEFENTDQGIRIANERHYRLVPHHDLKPTDLEIYSTRPLTD